MDLENELHDIAKIIKQGMHDNPDRSRTNITLFPKQNEQDCLTCKKCLNSIGLKDILNTLREGANKGFAGFHFCRNIPEEKFKEFESFLGIHKDKNGMPIKTGWPLLSNCLCKHGYRCYLIGHKISSQYDLLTYKGSYCTPTFDGGRIDTCYNPESKICTCNVDKEDIDIVLYKLQRERSECLDYIRKNLELSD